MVHVLLYLMTFVHQTCLSSHSSNSGDIILGLKKVFSQLRCRYGSVTIKMVAIVLLPSVAYIFTLPQQKHHYYYHRARWKGRTLLEYDEPIIDVNDSKFILGYALGSVSAVIYFFALPPQIIKNVSCVPLSMI